MGYQRAQLKMAAKRAMKESRCSPRLTTFLFLVVVTVSTWLVSLLMNMVSGMSKIGQFYAQLLLEGTSDPEQIMGDLIWAMGPGRLIAGILVGSVLGGLLTYLLSNLLYAGYNYYCLSVVRRQEPSMSTIFSGFSRIGSVLVTKLLTWVFVFLWSLLFAVALAIVMALLAVLAALSESEAMLVVMMLVMFVGYIGVFAGIIWVNLRYAMVDFLIMDRGLSGLECIRESKRLMKGNVGKLFVLRLSFIGWYLLEGLIIFVGILIAEIAVIAGAFSMDMGGDPSAAGILGMVGVVLLVVLAVVIAIFLINIWLTPYITGSVAMFYDWAQGARPAGPGYGGPGNGGWGAPGPQGQNYHYTWSDGSGRGSGAGAGGAQPDSDETVLDDGPGWGSGGWGDGGQQSGGSAPQPPRDDPWA